MQLDLSQTPVAILVFGMKGCPACEDYLPIFQGVAKRHSGVKSYAIDSDRPGSQADWFGVTATPTTVLWVNGAVAKRFEGQGSRADVEKLFRYAETLQEQLGGGVLFRQR